MKTRYYFTFLFLFIYSTSSFSQDSLQDPLWDFKYFEEVSVSASLSRINTEHYSFNTTNGEFNFSKNRYLPASDANFYWGWLLKDKVEKDIYSLKTGFGILNRQAHLTDTPGNEYNLNTGYLQIPFQFSIREPIKYQAPNKRMFQAIEYSLGLYVTAPVFQRLQEKAELDQEVKTLGFNYLRYGFIAQISFTSFDAKGHGHKFGIRATSDFTSITKFKETDNELYPFYYTIGLFYNIENNYWK